MIISGGDEGRIRWWDLGLRFVKGIRIFFLGSDISTSKIRVNGRILGRIKEVLEKSL